MMVSIISQQVMTVNEFLYMDWRRNYSQITDIQSACTLKYHSLKKWEGRKYRLWAGWSMTCGLSLEGRKQLFTKVSSCSDAHSNYSRVLATHTLRVKPPMHQGIKLTTHLHLQPRSRMHVVIPPLSRKPSGNGTLLSVGTTLPFVCAMRIWNKN